MTNSRRAAILAGGTARPALAGSAAPFGGLVGVAGIALLLGGALGLIPAPPRPAQ